jgi:methylated-DNA-[protein]-cysteine S-methyltransferase
MNQTQHEIKSKFRSLYLVASKDGLQGVFLNKQPVKVVKNLDKSKPEEKILGETVRQLEEYFAGTRKQFDIAFNFSGTAFQNRVWRELYKIPFGKTVSYKDIAKRIKNPKAVRAVGTANGKNPFCIIVPCHRVINANGLIGGYAGGIRMKRELLELEQKKH